MMHRTQDTYPLSHFRQHTGEHLKRLAKGRVETITQNGEAAMVVMSPETYDLMRITLERGHLWDEAIARFEAGERGVDAREVIEQVAARLNLKL
ncbi:MAG: type II toxin-antitoxin system prevent-host-death family antitoxin [Thermoanaerobaculia bacterium]|nr:type II toxin-antitoxin system prevent-host-death family antitoxin [Thermoanaerobaculia bacterium]